MVGGVHGAVIGGRFGENELAVLHAQVLVDKHVVQRTAPRPQAAVNPRVDEVFDAPSLPAASFF